LRGETLLCYTGKKEHGLFAVLAENRRFYTNNVEVKEHEQGAFGKCIRSWRHYDLRQHFNADPWRGGHGKK
jgi:hypothetical protein